MSITKCPGHMPSLKLNFSATVLTVLTLGLKAKFWGELRTRATFDRCVVSLCSLHLWRMPEMVAPRALVFRPLVKGNEDSGNEIDYHFKMLLKDNIQRISASTLLEIALRSQALEENPSLAFVRPKWIMVCHEKGAFVPFQPYIIVPS